MLGHHERAVGGVKRAFREGAISVDRLLRRFDGGRRRLQECTGLLGIVLEGGEHLGGIDARDGGEFGGCPIQIAALFDEAFAGLGDAARQRCLLGASLFKRSLDGAERVHVLAEVAHDGGGHGSLLGVARSVFHLLLAFETARNGGFGGLEGPGKFVGRGDSELGAREVEFVRGAADLFVG